MTIRAALLVAALLVPGGAAAHIELVFPVARYADQKSAPCGAAADARTEHVTAFPPGATIMVRWNETIDHPGHYRVSFDDDGDDDFYLPEAFDDLNEGHPTVLLDGIEDRPLGGAYETEVTLPDVECERCTLQVIQMMTDKAPYGDGNDIYFQCADLELREDADPAGEGAAPGCACARPTAGATASSALGLALLGAALLRRRRATSVP